MIKLIKIIFSKRKRGEDLNNFRRSSNYNYQDVCM